MQTDFDQHFLKQFGSRWEALKASLFFESPKVARWNQFSKEQIPPSEFPQSTSVITSQAAAQIPQDAEGLLKYYFLDLASIAVAEALKVQKENEVLDLCAAPGGKSLVLAEALDGTGHLQVNEPSLDRRERLKKNLRSYIPELKRGNLKVSGLRGADFCLKNKNSFDRILVDAPCSGEKYLIQNKDLLSEWSPKRTERLAQEQYSLLCAALLALKPGGRIVYSTCSISKKENDDVLTKIVKKKGESFKLVFEDPLLLSFEKSEYGYWILPDQSKWGPMYFSILEKI